MKVLEIKNEKGLLTATIKIEPREFAASLREAYLDNADRFAVPGFAAGLAPLEEVEKIYGPEAPCLPRIRNFSLSSSCAS